MWSLDYIDETIVDACKKSFRKIYPEFMPIVLGASQDKTCLIIECDMPDGTFYFRVTENSVSAAYKSKEDADRT